MPKPTKPTTQAVPKAKYSEMKALIYMPPVLRESLKVLAADNKARSKPGDNVSALLVQLGKRFAKQPERLLTLRKHGFKNIDALLAL